MKKTCMFFVLVLTISCAKTPEKLYEMGNKFYSRGNYYLAIESYTRAIMLKNKFPQAITARGMAYEMLGQKKKAAEEYEKSIYVDKNYLPPYNNLAAIHIEGGNYKNAAYYLENALKIKPDYNYALYSMGLIKFINKDYKTAAYYFEKSLTCSPTDAASYYLALTLEKLGDYERAGDYLIELFNKNSQNHEIAYQIGKIKYITGDPSAVEYLSTAIQKAQKPHYYYYRAKVNFSLGDYASASEDILKAIELDGWKNANYIHLAGEISASYGDKESAKLYYESAYKIHKDYEIYKYDMKSLNAHQETYKSKKKGRKNG